MTGRVQKCLESIQERMQAQQPGQGSYCTVKILDTVRHIPVENILYLEAVGIRHTLRMHLDDELLEFNSSLDHFTQQLGDGFWALPPQLSCEPLPHTGRTSEGADGGAG